MYMHVQLSVFMLFRHQLGWFFVAVIIQRVMKQKYSQDPSPSSSVTGIFSLSLLLPLHPISSVNKGHDHNSVLSDHWGCTLLDILSLNVTVTEHLHISKNVKCSWIFDPVTNVSTLICNAQATFHLFACSMPSPILPIKMEACFCYSSAKLILPLIIM